MAPLKYWKIKEYLAEVAVRPESATRMPTVRELMARFNVSLSTVNRALAELENEGIITRRQGSGIVSAGNTRQVKRLEPQSIENRKNLVFVYNDYPDESTWRMVHTVIQHARFRKCNILDFKIYQDTPTEAIIEHVRSIPDCSGLILLVGSDRMDQERLDALAKLPMKVAIVDSLYFYHDLPSNIYTLSPNPETCAALTIQTLVRFGHREVGYIRNEPSSEYTEIFRKTLLSSAREHGVNLTPERMFGATIRSWESSLDSAVQLTRANLDAIRREKLTAMIYKSSAGALVAQKILLENGIRIPEDISLISEGERSLYKYLYPALTVVTPDYHDMGCSAVDLVLGLSKPKCRNLFFTHTLVERDSIKNINPINSNGDKL